MVTFDADTAAPREQNTAADVQVCDDIAIYLMAGRVKGAAEGHGSGPIRAVEEAVDAERLGFRSALLAERYDLKNAPVLLGGAGARTSRIELGTAALTAFSRHPLIMASIAATMQAAYGDRFILGIGRGYSAGEALHPFGSGFDAFGDYVDIVRRLLHGEVVTYDGPAGKFERLELLDKLDGPPPQVWSVTLGGPRAAKVAARVADGMLMTPFLTPEATAAAVKMFRDERERLGKDPAARVCQGVVTACDMDESKTTNLTSARFVTYLVGFKSFTQAYARANGWDAGVMEKIAGHPLFTRAARGNADESFYRHQLSEPAALVPDEWMRASCAIGTPRECADRWAQFREAGADQLMLYGSTPKENAGVIELWKQRVPAV